MQKFLKSVKTKEILFSHENNSSVKLDARSNLANFNRLKIFFVPRWYILAIFTWTPTPYNLFICKYGIETESGRVSNSNTCQHGGNMITKGFFGQIFSWCNLFALFIPKKSF